MEADHSAKIDDLTAQMPELNGQLAAAYPHWDEYDADAYEKAEAEEEAELDTKQGLDWERLLRDTFPMPTQSLTRS